MPESKICPECGASVPGSASLFCNKCGARLPGEGPVDPLTCRACGKQSTDRESQFCDRCGAPLYASAQPLPTPVPRPLRKKACPNCGFENSGELLFFCKKCGVSLDDPGIHREPPGMIPGLPPRRPDNDEPLRRKTLSRARPVPRNAPEVSEGPPPKKAPGSYRNVAIGVAAVVIILIAVILLATTNPGVPEGDAENPAGRGLFEMIPFSAMPGSGLFSNQATPVVTDTPPEV